MILRPVTASRRKWGNHYRRLAALKEASEFVPICRPVSLDLSFNEPINFLRKIKSQERTIKTSMFLTYPPKSVRLVSAEDTGVCSPATRSLLPYPLPPYTPTPLWGLLLRCLQAAKSFPERSLWLSSMGIEIWRRSISFSREHRKSHNLSGQALPAMLV
jgi:hypothetical protein